MFDIPYLYSGSGHTLADAVAKEQILDPVTAVKEEIYRYLRICFLTMFLIICTEINFLKSTPK